MYRDRTEAGLILAAILKKYKGIPGVVLAVPRGGVPIGYIVAKELNLPLEILLSKKIGHPVNKEYAIGAVTLTDHIINSRPDVPASYVDLEINRIRKSLKEKYKKIMGDKEPENLKGKTVIVVDDGIATGNTLLTTINMLRKSEPLKIVVAAPVAPQTSINKLSKVVDEILVPLIPAQFYGVGAYYEDFAQVTDDEVIELLNKLRTHLAK